MAGGSGPIPRSGRLIKPPSTGRLIAILAATEDRFLRVELTLLYDWVISLRYNTLAWGFGRNGTKGKCIVMRLTFLAGSQKRAAGKSRRFREGARVKSKYWSHCLGSVDDMEIELVDPPILELLALEALEALRLYAPRVAPSGDRRTSLKIDLQLLPNTAV